MTAIVILAEGEKGVLEVDRNKETAVVSAGSEGCRRASLLLSSIQFRPPSPVEE